MSRQAISEENYHDVIFNAVDEIAPQPFLRAMFLAELREGRLDADKIIEIFSRKNDSGTSVFLYAAHNLDSEIIEAALTALGGKVDRKTVKEFVNQEFINKDGASINALSCVFQAYGSNDSGVVEDSLKEKIKSSAMPLINSQCDALEDFSALMRRVGIDENIIARVNNDRKAAAKLIKRASENKKSQRGGRDESSRDAVSVEEDNSQKTVSLVTLDDLTGSKKRRASQEKYSAAKELALQIISMAASDPIVILALGKTKNSNRNLANIPWDVVQSYAQLFSTLFTERLSGNKKGGRNHFCSFFKAI